MDLLFPFHSLVHVFFSIFHFCLNICCMDPGLQVMILSLCVHIEEFHMWHMLTAGSMLHCSVSCEININEQFPFLRAGTDTSGLGSNNYQENKK